MAAQKVARAKYWRDLTLDGLHAYLRYDPTTGVFTRPPKVVGSKKRKHRDGTADCVKIWVKGQNYPAHILAWIIMTGEWPPSDKVIDHIDGDPFNNQWSNLRLATPSQNQWNRSKVNRNNPTGLTGAYKRGDRWLALLGNKRLGMFPTAEAAHEAYVEAARQKFGEFLAERLK